MEIPGKMGQHSLWPSDFYVENAHLMAELICFLVVLIWWGLEHEWLESIWSWLHKTNSEIKWEEKHCCNLGKKNPHLEGFIQITENIQDLLIFYVQVKLVGMQAKLNTKKPTKFLFQFLTHFFNKYLDYLSVMLLESILKRVPQGLWNSRGLWLSLSDCGTNQIENNFLFCGEHHLEWILYLS